MPVTVSPYDRVQHVSVIRVVDPRALLAKPDHTLFMTSEREDLGQRNGQKLDNIVEDADEYYNYFKEKHVQPIELSTLHANRH